MRDHVILQKNQIQKFDTPVLFIIFNRPDNAKKVFDAIRSIKPTKLFVAADAPRYQIKNEYALCQETRAIIHQVDWPCEVKTLFQDTNLGVGRGGGAGINWFFEHVEAGIILEEDCVPSEEFFYFCQGALGQYRYNQSVMMVAGTSYLMGRHSIEGHYKSTFYPIWGWATWRRAWQLYDFGMIDWRTTINEKDLLLFWNNKRIVKKWVMIFDSIIENKLEAWDAQWVFACVKNKGKCIATPFNMISNIGLWGGHADGRRSPFHEMPVQQFDVVKVLNNSLPDRYIRRFDRETYDVNNFLYYDPYWRKMCRFVKDFLKNKFTHFS